MTKKLPQTVVLNPQETELSGGSTFGGLAGPGGAELWQH